MKIEVKEKLLQLLWPNICPFCGKAERSGICVSCRKKLRALTVREPRCMKCGKPVRYEVQEYCEDCKHTHHYYDRGVALWLHKPPVNISIYQFKYHNQRKFARYYAEEILAEYQTLIQTWRPEVIVPVPLYSKRRRERGYNQAQILGEELGRRLSVPVAGTLVKRMLETTPQKMLDHKERRRNLDRAFAVKRSAHVPKRVLLVDDIYTTGNTIDAVAKVLKSKGAIKVYFLTISIGQGY